MKLRNPVTRDMIANPKRNQGRHKKAETDYKQLLVEALDELEHFAGDEQYALDACGNPYCKDCLKIKGRQKLMQEIRESINIDDNEKYIVRYTGDYILRQANDGYYAILNATDHPRAGPGHVITSKLCWVNFELGVMETQNTIYVPEECK